MLCVCAQLWPTLCNPIDYNPPGSSVLGDFPGKNSGVGCYFLLQRTYPWPRDWTWISCNGRQILYRATFILLIQRLNISPSFYRAVRNTFMKWALVSLKRSMVMVFCKPEMTVAISELPEFSGNDEIIDWQGSSGSIYLAKTVKVWWL